MERNNQITELIARFLINDLNDEEHALVVNWINASEENRHYFINIKDTWQLTAVKLTEQVNSAEEYKLFRDAIAARDGNAFSIPEAEAASPKPVIYRRLLRVAVAAAVLLLVGLGWMYFNKGDRQPVTITKTEEKQNIDAPVVQHEVNTSGKEKNIMLADGSMVVLFNNSEITYQRTFINRQIKLTGKAFFRVHKDTTSPFTVESGAITTTALGTEFTVTAFTSDKQLSVRLYNGKVVVKPVAQENKLMKQAVYLMPGQEFIYGPNTTLVRNFNTGNPEAKKSALTANDNPSLPVNAKGSWRMYNNQALSQVFDHLAASYGVTIVYEAKDVKQKYFVGQFKTTDSIEVILQLITKANNLKYTREENTYIIHQ
jgi:ferric-dicitrate binding protein FerR (iron transport regulator)